MSTTLELIDPGRALNRVLRRAVRIVYIPSLSRSVRFRRAGGKQAVVRRQLPCNNYLESDGEHEARDQAFEDLSV